MPVSTAPAFVAGLKSQLTTRFAAHATLSAIRVDLVPSGDVSQFDSVILVAGPITGEQTYVAMGRRQDSYTIPGRIETYATGSDSDAAFQEAMNRAGLILDEVVREVGYAKPPVGAQTLDAQVTNTGYQPLVAEKGGWVCRCTYEIEYQAVVS
jgi:hypothetical protein